MTDKEALEYIQKHRLIVGPSLTNIEMVVYPGKDSGACGFGITIKEALKDYEQKLKASKEGRDSNGIHSATLEGTEGAISD